VYHRRSFLLLRNLACTFKFSIHIHDSDLSGIPHHDGRPATLEVAVSDVKKITPQVSILVR